MLFLRPNSNHSEKLQLDFSRSIRGIDLSRQIVEFRNLEYQIPGWTPAHDAEPGRARFLQPIDRNEMYAFAGLNRIARE